MALWPPFGQTNRTWHDVAGIDWLIIFVYYLLLKIETIYDMATISPRMYYLRITMSQDIEPPLNSFSKIGINN